MTEAVTITVNLAPRCKLTEWTALAFGLTVKAIRRKIEDGKWMEGCEYHRDPEGGIWLDVKGITTWAGKGPVLKSARSPSASPS